MMAKGGRELWTQTKDMVRCSSSKGELVQVVLFVFLKRTVLILRENIQFTNDPSTFLFCFLSDLTSFVSVLLCSLCLMCS